MNPEETSGEGRNTKTKDEQKKLTSTITEDSKQSGLTPHSSDNLNDNNSFQDVKYGSFRFKQMPNYQPHDDNIDCANNDNQQNLNQEQKDQAIFARNSLGGETCYTNLALSSDNGDFLFTAGSPDRKCDNYNEMFAKKRKSISDGGPKLTVFIERDSFPQHEFDTNYGKQVRYKDGIHKRILRMCQCNPISFILSLFPVLSWLPKYPMKEYLLPDAITGFTLAILQMPQGMAYGLLATVGAINGLYVSFFPVIMYFIMGSSRHISIGTFSVISIMIGNAADKVISSFSEDSIYTNTTNNFTGSHVEGGNPSIPTRLEIVVAMAMIVGLMQVGMGILRLGCLSVIMSDQLISGFTTGAATYVATSQLKDLFGIKISRHDGPLQLVYTYVDIFKALPTANVGNVIISAISIFILAVVKEQVNERYRHKLIMPIPVDLIITIAVTIASYYLKFESKYKMDIMGNIPTGLPQPSLPRLNIGYQILADSFSVGMVVFAISLSLAKVFAKKHGYVIYPNQELIALGSANIFSSFFSCFPCAVSLSRSMVIDRTGGKTQVAAFISCMFILVVLLFLSPLFYHLPKCILSCIILVALKGMFLQFRDLRAAWKVSVLDAAIWAVAFVAVILVSIDIGLLIGVAFSILIVLQRIVSPNKALLGNIPNTEIYVNAERYKECIELNDIKILHFGGALCFLNKEIFKNFVMEAVCQANLVQTSDLKNATTPSFVKQRIFYIILDCSSFAFLDLNGSYTLSEVENELKELGITLLLAECSVPVYEMLEKTGYFAKPDKGYQYVFPTVHDAVTYCQSTYNVHL